MSFEVREVGGSSSSKRRNYANPSLLAPRFLPSFPAPNLPPQPGGPGEKLRQSRTPSATTRGRPVLKSRIRMVKIEVSGFCRRRASSTLFWRGWRAPLASNCAVRASFRIWDKPRERNAHTSGKRRRGRGGREPERASSKMGGLCFAGAVACRRLSLLVPTIREKERDSECCCCCSLRCDLALETDLGGKEHHSRCRKETARTKGRGERKGSEKSV